MCAYNYLLIKEQGHYDIQEVFIFALLEKKIYIYKITRLKLRLRKGIKICSMENVVILMKLVVGLHIIFVDIEVC